MSFLIVLAGLLKLRIFEKKHLMNKRFAYHKQQQQRSSRQQQAQQAAPAPTAAPSAAPAAYLS